MAQDTILGSDSVYAALVTKVNNDVAELFAAIAALTIGSDMHNLVAKTADYSLTASDLTGVKTFTNDGAAAQINFSLLAGSANYQCHFIVTDAQYLKVTANGSEKFRYQGTEGAAGGYVRSNVVGTVFSITWSGDNWVIHGLEGELKYDE